jgi:hypothetical protein
MGTGENDCRIEGENGTKLPRILATKPRSQMSELANCPHCNQPGIIVGSSRWYSRGWPATCRQCGLLAYYRPNAIVTTVQFLFKSLFKLLIFEFLAPLIFVVLCIYFPGMFFIYLLAFAVFIFYLWRQRGRSPPPPRPQFTFHPISPKRSRLSRRLTYLAIVMALAAFGTCFLVAINR